MEDHRSALGEGNTHQVWAGLAMVETVRHDTERQRLDLGRRFLRTLAIRQYARQFKDFGDPAAVISRARFPP